MTYDLPWQGGWIRQTDKTLLALNESGKKADAEWFREMYARYEKNRLGFFLAHGGGHDFVNDYKSDLCMLLAGNQLGKTFHMLAWVMMRMLKVDPSWPCFTMHGDLSLKVPEWRGAQIGMIASYEWSHIVRNIWPKFSILMPEYELEEYSAHWNPREKGSKRKKPNFGSGSPSVELKHSGGRVDFGAYHQGQVAFESTTYQVVGGDEQMPEGIFDATITRGTTADNFQIGISATPHRVEGQPETGAGTFMHRLVMGVNTKGIKTGVYHIAINEVPDVIISPKKKKEAYVRNIVEPEASGKRARIEAGKSRYHGTFESPEGLVYDNWSHSLHVIDPIKIPSDWTRFRSFDPGETKPSGCLWAAMAPWGDLVFYREYYESGAGMRGDAKNIIELSGNRRLKVDSVEDEDGGVTAIFEEQYDSEVYDICVMDGRAFSQPAKEEGVKQSQVYADMGLDCQQGSGMRNETAVPIVKDWLEPIEGRTHIMVRLGLVKHVLDPDGKPVTSAPRTYVTSDLVHFITEIEGYINDPKTGRPVDKDDHLMCCAKYMLLKGPRYYGGAIAKEHYETTESQPYTGYRRADSAYS